MRRRLERYGRTVEKDYLNTFGLTVRSAALTCVLSLLVPALLWYLGARLATFDAPDLPVAAFGAGLDAAAWVIASLELCRQLCRRRGLAEAHFRWRPAATALLRSHVNVLLPIAGPVAFVVGTTQGQPNEQWQNSLGRLAFIVGMAAFAVAFARLFRPHGALCKDGFRDLSATGKLALFLVAFGTPAALAGMAELGYYFTAYQLSLRLLPSLWAATVAAMAYALALRWATTARGELALQRAAAKRRGDGKQIHDQGLDIATINLHTRRLARTGLIVVVACGLWSLWADVLPAFKGIADYTLWTLPAELVDVASAAAKPADAKPTEAKPLDAKPALSTQDVQVKHLALALAVLWLTVSIGRSAPGMVEVVLATGGQGDPGFRYALAALLRYAIGFVGLLLCARSLGLHWANVQWLVAGMTVGLGFGLQEIFANFISGLILLFERPIRLGDTVTVGDLTGTVTKLRIRATTITDGAHRELVVPNKEFITGKLINWTLSDRSARVQLSVGVAYGTDPDLAMRTLLDVAAAHPKTLKDPPPSATFEGFGPNALDFKLSAYVANLDDATATKHALNTAIVHAFHEAEIECAQPRCEVVVRNLDGEPTDYGGLLAGRRSA